MYPDPIDPDTGSAAERQLYALLRDQLSDDHVVFHGVAWQALSGEGRRRDGEADFVILHPANGILIVEVKGGEIVRDAATGSWQSIDRHGSPHDIKNPIRQARESQYCFRDLLDGVAGRPMRSVNIGHAAAFPDVYVGDELLAPEAPSAILLGQNHLADLPAWVRGAFDYYRGTMGRRETAPGREAIDRLVAQLGARVHLRPVMWGEIGREKEQQAELTRQQVQVLRFLGRRSRALISGCAGSGKSMLAVEKASRLAESGFAVLLTCYNKNLAAFLRARLGPRSRLTVQHFHELGYELAARTGTLPANPAFDTSFFADALPEAMLEALDREPTARFDAIVVDEGQDFEDAWWIPLQSMLHDPDDGIFYIFYDAEQSLYNAELGFPIDDEPYVLDVNCRNTRHIAEQVRRFSGSHMRLPQRAVEGRPVEVLRYEGRGGLAATLAATLDRLVEDDGVPGSSIVVLSPLARSNPHTALHPRARIGRFALTEDCEPAEGEIRCSTIHGFKGCESDVVILVEAEQWPEDRNRDSLLYVATSRARHHLIVVLPNDAPEPLVARFAR
jgi:hypothetical protein